MSRRNKTRSHLLRMAVFLRERLMEFQEPILPVFPEGQWLVYQRLARLSQKAVNKGWLAAAAGLCPRREQALRDLREVLDGMLAEQKQPLLPVAPSLREVDAELLGLFEEFPEADVDLRRNSISVVTDPVTLDDVYLGPFRIELNLENDNGFTYEVVALEPNPSANNEDVTHPHVQNRELCEGEGIQPIRQALKQGRLGDFFQIVSQILHTYNPGSAYVSLGDWDGVSCAACGCTVAEDDRTSCWTTSDIVCYDCAVACPGCDHDFAPDSVTRCTECEEEYCHECLDEGRCHACCEKIEEEENKTEQPETETASGRCRGVSAAVERTEPLETPVG